MREPVFRRFFLAFRPPRAVAAEIAFWRESFLFGGRPVANERLHMTMFMLGNFDRVPHDLIARVKEALSTPMPACRIVLDQLAGGGGSALLVPSEPVRGLRDFQACLAGRLQRSGIGHAPWWRFSPHVSLLYDHGYCGQCPIDAISWSADELVLVESLVGRSTHIGHAVWPLGEPHAITRPGPAEAPSRSAPAPVR